MRHLHAAEIELSAASLFHRKKVGECIIDHPSNPCETRNHCLL